MNESSLIGPQPSGLYTNTMGNYEKGGRQTNERPKTGMATSGAGLNSKKLTYPNQNQKELKKQHSSNIYSKTNAAKMKPGQALAPNTQKTTSVKNLNNLKIGLQNSGTSGYPMAS